MKVVALLIAMAVAYTCLGQRPKNASVGRDQGIPVFQGHQIPPNNLAYPALITLSTGATGSGFYLISPNRHVFLITAKHVLFDQTTGAPLASNFSVLSYLQNGEANLLKVSLPELAAAGNVREATGDAVAVRVFKGGESIVSVPDETLTPYPGVTLVAAGQFTCVDSAFAKRLDQVNVGNDIILFGFPSSLALQQMNQLDPNRPLLRKGIVAGVDSKRKTIIIDAPVYFGNSGGLVTELDRHGPTTEIAAIGIVSQYVPFAQTTGSQTMALSLLSNSGYAIVTPMDAVLDLIRDF